MVIQSDSSSEGQNKDFQPTFRTSVLLTCAVILVNYDSIASKYWNTFPSSSIPSKGKCLYKFSARSEKTVYLNVLKCNASLNNLFYSWEYSGWLIKPLILINQLSVCVGETLVFKWMSLIARTWGISGSALTGSCCEPLLQICVLIVQLSGRSGEREQVFK